MKANLKNLNLGMARKCIGKQELADRAGITRQTLTNVLAECSVEPKTIGKIAKTLEVDAEELIAWEE